MHRLLFPRFIPARIFSFVMITLLSSYSSLNAASPDEQPQDPTPSESQIVAGIIAAIAKQVDGRRDAHPKAHGCVAAEVEVLDQLGDLQTGLFSSPGQTYEALIRFSSGSSDSNADDRTGGSQGMALKILLPEDLQSQVSSIQGEKFFVDEKYYRTQDIITISGIHDFMVNGVSDYPEFLAAVGASTKAARAAAAEGKSPKEIQAISSKVMDDLYLHLNGQPGIVRLAEARLLAQVAAAKPQDLTTESYQSWVPSRYGDFSIKYQLRPCDPGSEPLQKRDSPNFLAENLTSSMESSSLCFELAVQIHEPGFPSIEDAAQAWVSSEFPERIYLPVARVTVAQAMPGTPTFIDPAFCEKLSFNPGHAVPEHFPVGSIQRTRIPVYAAIETLRNEQSVAKNPANETP